MEEHLLNLLQKVREHNDADARTELNEMLRKHSEARTVMASVLVDEQAIVSHLRDESLVAILDHEGESDVTLREQKRSIRLLAWPQQVAVALVVGAIIGLLGVEVVWAVGSPKSQASVIPVANGGFEVFSGPVETGIPTRFGRWAGNPSEVIEDADGNRSLRFLKTGNVKGSPDSLASNCSVFQFVDLSSVRQRLGTQAREMQITLNLSARFRREAAATDSELPKLNASCRIYLFDAEPKTVGEGWPGVVNEEGVGYGKKAVRLAPNGELETITASCLLDPDATVALIVVTANTHSLAAPVELGGYFVDDVQLTAISQPTLPVRYVK